MFWLFAFIGIVIWSIFQAVLWVICLPFRLIGFLFSLLFELLSNLPYLFEAIGEMFSSVLRMLFRGDASVVGAKILLLIGLGWVAYRIFNI